MGLGIKAIGKGIIVTVGHISLFLRLKMAPLSLITFILALSSSAAFVPLATVRNVGSTSGIRLVDPSVMDAGVVDSIATAFQQSTFSELMASNFAESASSTLAFSDQGKNLAGIFFQASLLPYLLFLYFLSFRANRINNIGNFGFQFILLFVLSTIPSGIISKSTYGCSLADVDWLHGGAELLLTVANVLIVGGFGREIPMLDPAVLGVSSQPVS